MYNVRLAVMQDWDKLQPMLQDFYAFSESEVPMDNATMRELFVDVIKGNGEIVIATAEEKPVGIIGFLTHPHMVNKHVIVGTELLWWVEPDHRGTQLAKVLMETAEEIARVRYGAKQFTMSALRNSGRGVEVLYRRAGYKQQDTSYTKAI